MANFKAHLSAGALLGVGSVAVATAYSITSDNTLLALGFIFAIIGSLLPDLDSDEGRPLRIVLHLLATLCALIAFMHIRIDAPGDTLTQLFTFMAVYGFVRYVVGNILKRFTHHRGIFHSVPAMLLAFLAGLLMLDNFGLGNLEKLLIAGSLAAGYLGHLILDEVKSATSFSGFRMRRSLGSALKLVSRSKVANIAVYVLILAGIYLNLPLLRGYVTLFQKLLS